MNKERLGQEGNYIPRGGGAAKESIDRMKTYTGGDVLENLLRAGDPMKT